MTVDEGKNDPSNRTITARLIDGSESLDHAVHGSIEMYKDRKPPHADFEKCMVKHQGHHSHHGEIQVFDGTNDGAGLVDLPRGDYKIRIDDNDDDNYVQVLPSYDKFMPKLTKIAQTAGLGKPGVFNKAFITHTVTINRGVVRVRDVGDWDGGSITIPPGLRDGEAVYQAAKVRFLKANVYGYVATECVIEIEDAKKVAIVGPDKTKRIYTGNKGVSRRVAENTIEILITNYAPQQDIALPWTLHYRWMFEAAGYSAPIDLRGSELNALRQFGKKYDEESWVCESEMFLGEEGHESGYPFPYRTVVAPGRSSDMWIVRLGDLDYNEPFPDESVAIPSTEKPDLVPADPWDPVRCPMGDYSPDRG